MITDFQLFEGKQVGVIYHFTSIYSLYKILSTREPYLGSTPLNFISCTRNFDMKSNELKLEKQCCRIALDGNKLSEKYRIRPHFDIRYPEPEEREERVFTNYNPIPLDKYIIRIDILNNPPIGKNDSAINSYSFEPNQYLGIKKPKDIISNYDRFKDQITSLNNSKYPIHFVDRMNPIKLNENSITDFYVPPPKIMKKSGGDGNYKYYAIFDEMFLPKKLITLISPNKNGTYLLNKIIKNNPYKQGLNEFLIIPTYVNNVNINGKFYDKIILNDHLKSPFESSEEDTNIIHKDLILNILDKHNDENINLENVIKFNSFSSTPMGHEVDDDWWEQMIEQIQLFFK